jgi:hypothetical protein
MPQLPMHRPHSDGVRVPRQREQPPAERRTLDTGAIASLALSILILGGLGSVLGIIIGVIARRRIVQADNRGGALALAGINVGVVTLILAVLFWIFLGPHLGSAPATTHLPVRNL